MLIQWVFELLMPIIVILTLVTQVIIPALRGTSYFPSLRRRVVHGEAQAAAEELEQAEEHLRAARLHREAQRVRARVDREEDSEQIEQSVAGGVRGVRLRRDTQPRESESEIVKGESDASDAIR